MEYAQKESEVEAVTGQEAPVSQGPVSALAQARMAVSKLSGTLNAETPKDHLKLWL
jgi:hypothetical protein